MSPNRQRSWRENLLEISLSLIGVLCLTAILVAYLTRGETSQIGLGQPGSDLGRHASCGHSPAQGAFEGMNVQNLTRDLRERLGVPSSTEGVIISKLDPTCPAAQSGIRQGDVIESVYLQPVHSVADLERLASQAKSDTLVRISRQGNRMLIIINPAPSGGGSGR